MTKDERLYLEDLSLKVYGRKSRYLKMVNRGEAGPKDKDTKIRTMSYYTIDEIKTTMEEIWAEEVERIAKAKKEAITHVETSPDNPVLQDIAEKME